MIRLAISVEGRTEEEFVKTVLAGHLRENGVEPQPFLLNGNVTIDRLASDMARHIWNFDRVTSLVDFYGFKGKGWTSRKELEQRIRDAIDRRIARSWDRSRAFPYVQQYEFEGLLFSNVSAFGDAVIAADDRINELRKIRQGFPTPEDINDNRDTAPSKRIFKAVPRYNKVVHGSLIAEATGLDMIRAECPRFNAWVERLESFGSGTRV